MKETVIKQNDKIVFVGSLGEASKWLGKYPTYLMVIKKLPYDFEYDIYVDGKPIPKRKHKTRVSKLNKTNLSVGETFNIYGNTYTLEKVCILNARYVYEISGKDFEYSHHTRRLTPITYEALERAIRREINDRRNS